MKTYEYKTVDQEIGEEDGSFLKKVNELALQGYRYIGESFYENGRGRVVLERELDA